MGLVTTHKCPYVHGPRSGLVVEGRYHRKDSNPILVYRDVRWVSNEDMKLIIVLADDRPQTVPMEGPLEETSNYASTVRVGLKVNPETTRRT